MKMLRAESDVMAAVKGTQEYRHRLRNSKETTYARWKHDVAIAGLQYDLLVLSSVYVVRIIKHVVRS